jgi:hypothetical protein
MYDILKKTKIADSNVIEVNENVKCQISKNQKNQNFNRREKEDVNNNQHKP